MIVDNAVFTLSPQDEESFLDAIASPSTYSQCSIIFLEYNDLYLSLPNLKIKKRSNLNFLLIKLFQEVKLSLPNLSSTPHNGQHGEGNL